jgi:hypothetical protein
MVYIPKALLKAELSEFYKLKADVPDVLWYNRNIKSRKAEPAYDDAECR